MNKKHKNFNNKNNKYPELNSNEKFILVPQQNKYITIYHNHLQPNPPIINNDKNNDKNKDITKTRIIVRKPKENDGIKEGGGNEDEFLSQLFGSLFNGVTPGVNNLDPLKSSDNLKNQKKIQQEEIVVPIIDRDKLKFIEEKPKTLDDLLELSIDIEKKYDIEEYYNFDLKKLKALEKPLSALKKMVGLEEVKNKIADIILYYLQRLDIKNQDMLHTIIDGAPGTGKTEIALIYSEILVSLGVLSKGTFRKAKKHDLIGGYLGHTAIKTSKLLEEVKGGVLFIDEIYSLGNSDGKEGKDIYAKECVDLLMEFMSENKSDFVLVVAGYKEDIQRFFLTMNDGLERRFPIHLSIGEYTSDEMKQIFIKKINEMKWSFDDNFIPNDFFKENKEYFKYYGGDMEILLSKCKYAHSRNLVENNEKIHRLLDKTDFLDGFELYKKNPEIEARNKSGKFLSLYL
jgi:SpoVK/Ycf46/Vps4 family AAA+-type ATPase